MAPPINRRSFHQQHIAVFVLLLVFLIIAVLFVLLVFLFVLLFLVVVVVFFFLSSSFLPSVWFTFKFVFYENVGVCVCQQQNYLHLLLHLLLLLLLLLHRAFFLHYFSGWFVSQHFLKCQFGAEVVVVQQQQSLILTLTHALTQANFYFRVMVVTIFTLSLINQAELVPLF
jgi:hypothetical protein